MSEIPDERDILKTDLWKRIDQSIEVNNTNLSGLHSRLDDLITKISVQVAAMLDSSLAEINKSRLQLGSDFSETFKRLTVQNEELAAQYRRMSQEQMVKLDQSLLAFRSETLLQISREVGERLSEAMRQFKELRERTDQFQADMKKTFEDGQAANTKNIGAVAATAQDCVERLKKAGKALG